jgi:hypothetical protein
MSGVRSEISRRGSAYGDLWSLTLSRMDGRYRRLTAARPFLEFVSPYLDRRRPSLNDFASADCFAA